MITIQGLLAVFIAIAIVRIEGNCNNSPTDDLLMRLNEISKYVLNSCAIVNHHEFSETYHLLKNCLEERAFSNLNQLLNKEVIEVSKAIKIVKIADNSNITRKPENIVLGNNQKAGMLDKVLDAFHTHAVNINLAKFVDYNSPAVVEGRRRRRRHRHQNMMAPLMGFGLIAMLMIMIPMGFKFLTILGAKALLLAKMALILTSIQGLKKVATSGLNYGLYQAPPIHQSHHDRYGYLENQPDYQQDSFRQIS